MTSHPEEEAVRRRMDDQAELRPLDSRNTDLTDLTGRLVVRSGFAPAQLLMNRDSSGVPHPLWCVPLI